MLRAQRRDPAKAQAKCAFATNYPLANRQLRSPLILRHRMQRDKPLQDIDDLCVTIRDQLSEKIFGSLSSYHTVMRTTPFFVVQAGLNSECSMSRDQFEQEITRLSPTSKQSTNKLLYFSDCEKLISGIQEGSKEIVHILGQFYRVLNLEPLFFPENVVPDGIRFVSSTTTSNLFALLNFIYIRLHSLLDYSTKLAFEVENPRSEFSRYPRLASRGKLFGDKRSLSVNEAAGTLFQSVASIREVEITRNQIIHEGFLDLLARIEALRVERSPPFCAPLALWLSITAADGLTSRPSRSRTAT